MKYYVLVDFDGDIVGIVRSNNKAEAWKKVAKKHKVSLAITQKFYSLQKPDLY